VCGQQAFGLLLVCGKGRAKWESHELHAGIVP
jgi:hypothetical protein